MYSYCLYSQLNNNEVSDDQKIIQMSGLRHLKRTLNIKKQKPKVACLYFVFMCIEFGVLITFICMTNTYVYECFKKTKEEESILQNEQELKKHPRVDKLGECHLIVYNVSFLLK